jgi:hypothetical protein
MENRKLTHVLSGGWHQWDREDIRKGWKCYVFVYGNGKTRPVETIPGMGGGQIKEKDGWGESNYDIL